MSAPIQEGPPYKFVAGDSVEFRVSNPNYPSPAWTMAFLMFYPDFVPPSFAGAGQSDGSFLVTVSAPQTDTILPEEYQAAAVYTNSSTSPATRQTVILRTVWVLPDLTQKVAPSPNQTLLMALVAALQSLSSGTNKSASVNGQSYTKKDLGELQKQIYVTQSAVNKEREQLNELLGVPNPNVIPVSFAPLTDQPPYGVFGGPGYCR